MALYVGSTPFAPAGWSGQIEVEAFSLDEAKALVEAARAEGDEVVSYCGHPASARFFGVDVNRASAPAPTPGETQEWIGVRPIRRPNPGEELSPEKTPEAFVGCSWTLRGKEGQP